ncbi:hypothetical protein N0V90_007680 [Kalmusia sp. IMI 367209]|nr:hypothetical protein N0V90_007680 [Kalmusia sp. IMI 367209]
MTKDWDTVQEEIKDLSWVQKKRLDEVRKIMESKHGFKASTRAYRMKLSEWGYTTRKVFQKTTKDQNGKKRKRRQDESDDDSESDSTATGTPRNQDQATSYGAAAQDPENLETVLLGRATGTEDVLPPLPFGNPDELVPEARVTVPAQVNGVVMSMLAAVLEGDSQKLESLIMQHPSHINLPIGQPFDIPGSRFYNHPAMSTCVILQHPEQTLLDVASALPPGPVVWVLLAHGGKGSKHPLGTDLALHNAIKNGRTYTVQALLLPNRSNVNGEPGTTWKPILQAVYWNHPEVVRLLIDRGASVNETSPWVDGTLKNRDFLNLPIKEKCNKILKLLLNAGADIHANPGGEGSSTVFETFIRPWQGDPHWISKLSADELECLEAFVRKGADLKTIFMGFTCGALSSNQFQHQILWHTTPFAARLIVDHASPNPEGNGSTLLHEIVGSCPDAKRHPSDTLRDIEVLLRRGADPNHLDDSNFTPLRRCIERCPAVDIIPRLRLLLDGGADPELKHSNRLPPYVLAARTFEEPLRSQVMDFLVAKIKGRQHRVIYDETFEWTAGYFPISGEPTWDEVQAYNGQNGEFNANLDRMIPEDVRTVFQRACFSVASINFLNSATLRAKLSHPLPPTVMQKDEIYQAVAQRQVAGLPVYSFDQDFVMLLLKPHMAPVLPAFSASGSKTAIPEDFLLPHQTPISSTAQDEPSILATSSTFQFNAPSTSRNDSQRSKSPPSNSDIDFSMPDTTLIRWPHPGSRTRPGDVRKAKENVLRHTCDNCGNGNLLTRGELDKHLVEHEHTNNMIERLHRSFKHYQNTGRWFDVKLE